ncbi:MAG: ribosome assembly RNA-binding protein YhbY [Betaproteobacteria bacterium]|nr:ribosome assembly RNA-binding protein YhbY [Betaproteobacteria bacterium]
MTIATSAEPLAPRSLRGLRARAHALKPVVWIASTGPTEGVVRELDRALAVHELVKIHAAIDDRKERGRLLQSLCQELGAEPVQTIGKMLVAFRPRPQPAEPPVAKPRAGGRPGKRDGGKAPARRARPAARSRNTSAAASRRVRRQSR